MVYDCRIDNLIAALAAHVPTQKLKQIVQKHRTSELGLLSVGFKLHCLELMPRLDELMVKLWRETTDHKNLYLKEGAVQCWVFPPVGNANTAIAILETIEKAAGIEIFDNPKIQIQVCSPGRLSPKAAAYLTIGVCLGSDVLKDYRFEDLETSFSKARQFYTNNMASEKPRWGRRLALYDAGGFLVA